MGGADTVHASIRDSDMGLPGHRAQEATIEASVPVDTMDSSHTDTRPPGAALRERIDEYTSKARDFERRKQAMEAAGQALAMARELSSGEKVVILTLPDVASRKIVTVEVKHPNNDRSGQRFEFTVPESNDLKAIVIDALVRLAERRAENQERSAARGE